MRFNRTFYLFSLTVFVFLLTSLAHADLEDFSNEQLLLAEQGHASDQFRLGFMYATGKGVPQDYV